MRALTSDTLRDMPVALVEAVRETYNHFQALGYFEAYGGVCVTTAHLLKKIFLAKNFNARVLICYACVISKDKELVIGYRPLEKDGFVDVHAVCIVDDIALLDFATSSAREFMGDDFYQSLVVIYHPNPPFIARFHDDKYSVLWGLDSYVEGKSDDPVLMQELERNVRAADILFDQYTKFTTQAG